jgi:hypothetical protein
LFSGSVLASLLSSYLEDAGASGSSPTMWVCHKLEQVLEGAMRELISRSISVKEAQVEVCDTHECLWTFFTQTPAAQ